MTLLLFFIYLLNIIEQNITINFTITGQQKRRQKKTVKQNKNKQTNTEKSEIRKFNMTLLLANKCLTPQMIDTILCYWVPQSIKS